ncbi:hypothetical protein [Paraburkholderia hospita]|nr:hypothetical protein [Paraburkholderia hospita]
MRRRQQRWYTSVPRLGPIRHSHEHPNWGH